MLTLVVLLAAFGPPPAIEADPLAVTPEMRAWAVRHAPRGPEASRWRHFGRDLRRLPFAETPLSTLTAAEAFRRQRGNCVAFAHLAVALAREAGLPAAFVLVEDGGPTLKRDELRVVQRHLAVALGDGERAVVFDLGGTRRADDREYRVSDQTALAIFFSNQGAERLLADAPEEASRWLRAAVHTDPALARAWINLGVAERRSGRPSLAVLAYRQALTLSPESPSALNNLAVLQGRPWNQGASP